MHKRKKRHMPYRKGRTWSLFWLLFIIVIVIFVSNHRQGNVSVVSVVAMAEDSMANKVPNPASTPPAPKGLPFPPLLGPDNIETIIWEEKKEDDTGVGVDGGVKSRAKISSVPTKMNYVTSDTVEAHVRRDVTGCDSGIEGLQWDPVELQVTNARPLSMKIKENGFQLINDPLERKIDFLDTNDVIDHYYPSCEKLLTNVLGKGVTVRAFDHNIRISSNAFGPKLKGSSSGSKAQVPLGIVHGDYTTTSGPKRLHDLCLPPKANDVLRGRLGENPLLDVQAVELALVGKRRFALINVWRNIDADHPVEELPLACVDAKTVPETDLRLLKIHYPDRIGQNYLCTYSPTHQWMYFPNMVHAEALLIKQWDSHGDFALEKKESTTTISPSSSSENHNNECSTFAIHSAFVDPTSPNDARPRKSIEVRCAVIWDEEE